MSPLQLTCDFSQALAHQPDELEALTAQLFIKLITSQALDNLKRLSEPIPDENDITQFVPGIIKMQINPASLSIVIGLFKELMPDKATAVVLLERQPYRQTVHLNWDDSAEAIEEQLNVAIAPLSEGFSTPQIQG